MTTDQWLSAARADAERRGLPELIPILESLAAAIATLRMLDLGPETPAVEGSMPAESAE